MNREQFELAREHFETVERCERALITMGTGKSLSALFSMIPQTDILRYIEAGLEFDLDMARDELQSLGVTA